MFFQQQQCSTAAATSKICGYFPYNDGSIFNFLRQTLFALPYIAAGILCWVLFKCLGQHGSTCNVIKARNLKIALGALIIGPIILVNVWLKAFSGRPRPRQTDLFGGTLDFVQAGSFAGKCVSNCSFISGEAASAGWLFCLIFIIPQPARAALALPIAAASILMPALRVAFGAHYLSDAVLGWLSSPVVFAGLFALSQTAHGVKIYKD
jgi:membrane-associated phospholipid phosphatase